MSPRLLFLLTTMHRHLLGSERDRTDAQLAAEAVS
jgi:hypothetical protein